MSLDEEELEPETFRERKREPLSPLDGRYADKVHELRDYFSESGLIKAKLIVEFRWLEVVNNKVYWPFDFSDAYKTFRSQLNELVANAQKIEKDINHDTKAVEIALRQWVEAGQFESVNQYLIHFGLTSEDVTGLARTHNFYCAWNNVMMPFAFKLLNRLRLLAIETRDSVIMGMTHGQPASPSTFGKEVAVFISRLKRAKFAKAIDGLEYYVKFGSGASGNFSALNAAAPEVDWPTVCADFVQTHYGFSYDDCCTQAGNRETMCMALQRLGRHNSILLDLCQDFWLYASRGLLKLKNVKEEVGSSTMPHKINPIQFENAEGNLVFANGLIETIVRKVPISRMQRDLSDSTVLRNLGVVFGHTLVAWKSIMEGLERVSFDVEASKTELQHHPELMAEPFQTIMRKHPDQFEDPYEELRRLVRGHSNRGLTYGDAVRPALEKLRDQLVTELGDEVIPPLNPELYTGLAGQLVNRAVMDRPGHLVRMDSEPLPRRMPESMSGEASF